MIAVLSFNTSTRFNGGRQVKSSGIRHDPDRRQLTDEQRLARRELALKMNREKKLKRKGAK